MFTLSYNQLVSINYKFNWISVVGKKRKILLELVQKISVMHIFVSEFQWQPSKKNHTYLRCKESVLELRKNLTKLVNS